MKEGGKGGLKIGFALKNLKNQTNSIKKEERGQNPFLSHVIYRQTWYSEKVRILTSAFSRKGI